MAYKTIYCFSLVILLIRTAGVYCKFDRIKFFLTNHEITQVTSVERRTPPKLTVIDDAEKSIQIKAFGKTFIIDLFIYYQREDTEVAYISKQINSTDTYLASQFLTYQGFVRDEKDSFVLGFFSKTTPFRGYVVTDEVYCVEPYGKNGSVIVYRFRDVMVPGCSQHPGDEKLDCSETRYFTPWKANKPPLRQTLTNSYSLFYDKYLEHFSRLQAKKNKTDINDKSKDEKSGNDATKTDKSDKRTDGDDRHSSKNDTKDYDTHVKNKTKDHKSDDSGHKKKDHDKDISHGSDGDHNDHKNNKKDKSKGGRDDDDVDDKQSKTGIKEKTHKIEISNEISGAVEDIPYKKQTNSATMKEPVVEALSNDVPALKCNVELVVGKSFRDKFLLSDESVMKEIFIQFTLLNKIFRKVPFSKNGNPLQLLFNVETITLHGDEVYSPFTSNADIEYFTKIHRDITKSPCLTIGLVNKFMSSGQLFDGYIPEAKGGVCSRNAHTLIISHGNQNTPAPMALYFAALVRGITRAMGANDKDPQCEEGTYPNPMQVLQDYILAKEITLTKEYSIFTVCNIKEIDQALRGEACLVKISDPLCGNAILDPGEECDCGPTYLCNKIDSCCNPLPSKFHSKKNKSVRKGCTLVKGAKCSEIQECCSACQIDTTKRVCFSGVGVCDIATCDEKSADCPSGVEFSDGMICSTSNETMPEPLICKDNKCDQPLCSGFGLMPCTCAYGTGRDCVYCCLKEGKCKAAGAELNLVPDRDFFLANGVECMGGKCIDGKCTSLSGEQVIYKFNLKKPPQFPAEVNACRTHSILKSVINIFLALFLIHLL